MPDRLVALALLLWGGLVVGGACQASFAKVAWPDECIYLVGARNVVERGTLQTNFYLTYSLLIRGYPHRDVHMPGYVLALAPFVRALGPGMGAAVALNGAALLGTMLAVFALGRRLFPTRAPAVAAAALLPLMPPFPGYLTVVYPEIVITFVLLAGLAWLARGGGTRHALAAGALLASGALFRETLLLAVPLYFVTLPPRAFWRGFVPGLAVTLLVGVAPFSRDRAVHPNALYPSVFMEAQRSADPVGTFTRVVLQNVRTNAQMVTEAAPWSSAEDATLVFLAVLIALPAVFWRRLPEPARRFAAGTWASLAVLLAAVLVLYVVRERGGVWGGVRAFMCWAPVLLLLVCGGVAALPGRARVAVLVLAVGLFLGLDKWQIYRFYRYKRADLEDQDRNARYLEKYIGNEAPHRIVSRSFIYGYEHYPVEVVWSLPRDREELTALENAVDYEYFAIHEKHPIRLYLIQNPRYLRVNKDDKGAEFILWRRLY
jgi:hypothetical protein